MGRPPTAARLQRLRAWLETRYDELGGEVEALERGATESPGGGLAERQADEGAVSSTRADDLDLLDDEDELLRALGEALRRMDQGTYGRCTACGGWIEPERLDVLPYAERCIACARG